MSIRTRFAPSPTGELHLGGAWTALASWVLARRDGGTAVLRIEDLDPPRVVRGSAERIMGDLRWLGLTWDEAPLIQSARRDAYDAALATLRARGLTYPCDCSRAEIARAASAPHPGEESVYPGTCRALDPRRECKRAPAIRLRVPHEAIAFDDGVTGAFEQDIAAAGDFIVKRGDDVFAYQLAVVVDDLATEITDVVRGDDLLTSTPRQIYIARCLGLPHPRYWHVPIVVASDGSRLAKRTRGAAVRALRESGVAAEEILGELAHGLGITSSAAPRAATEIASLARRQPISWRRAPWPIPARWGA